MSTGERQNRSMADATLTCIVSAGLSFFSFFSRETSVATGLIHKDSYKRFSRHPKLVTQQPSLHQKMNSTTAPTDADRLLAIAEILFAYVGLIIFVVGTFGNLMNSLLFSRLTSLNTLASSVFLLVSFIFSQSVLVTGLLTRVIRGFSGVDPVNTSVTFCKVRWTIRTISNAVCLTCVCLAAIDRYFLSCSNVRRHRLITTKRARWAILISIVFWSGIFSSYAVYYTSPKPSTCLIADPVFAYFATSFNLIHYSILPLSILTIFCVLTWRNLGQQPGTYLRGGVRLYDQVTRMLIAQSFGICVTSTPNMIWQIYAVTNNSTTKDPLRQAQENLLNTICVLIGFSTHAITFYVYLLASATFRKNVTDIISRSQRITPASHTDMVKITLAHEDQKTTGPSARY